MRSFEMMMKLQLWKHRLAETLWFLPLLMMAGALALAAAMPMAEGPLRHWLGDDWLPMGPQSPEAARLLLSTIAAAMITVAALVFSMTLVVLTLAARQLGPRLLRPFMADRLNQQALGVFIASFVYALISLANVTNEGELPEAGILMALLLTLASFMLLVRFVENIARAIQPETVIARTVGELYDTLELLFPDGESRSENPSDAPELSGQKGARPLRLKQSGYVQSIHYDRLVELLAESDLRMEFVVRPGRFVIAGMPVAWIGPASRIEEDVVKDIRSTIATGPVRTSVQDVEHAFRALVEVALRALSPGVNDSFTALACADRLGAAVAMTFDRPLPPRVLHDGKGTPRVASRAVTVGRVCDAAFDQVRQAGLGNVAMTVRLLQVLTTLAGLARHERHLDALREHAGKMAADHEDHVPNKDDRADIARHVEALEAALAEAKRRIAKAG